VRTFEAQVEIETVAITSDQTRLLSGSRDSVLLWDISSGRLLASFADKFAGATLWLAVSPDNSYFVACNHISILPLWRLKELQMPQATHFNFQELWSVSEPLQPKQPTQWFSGHTDIARCAVFSSDSHLLFSGSQDKSICIWQVSTGQLLSCCEFAHETTVSSIVLAGTSLLVSSDEQTVKLWLLDPVTNQLQLLRSLLGHIGIGYVAVDPSGTHVCFNTYNRDTRRSSLYLWDTTSGSDRELAEIEDPVNSQFAVVSSVSISASVIASCNSIATICLWERDGLRKRTTLRGHTNVVTAAVFMS
jgi:WD40 repeat protein